MFSYSSLVMEYLKNIIKINRFKLVVKLLTKKDKTGNLIIY